jgi:murein endopeptidase
VPRPPVVVLLGLVALLAAVGAIALARTDPEGAEDPSSFDIARPPASTPVPEQAASQANRLAKPAGPSRAEKRLSERRRLQASIAWRKSHAVGSTGAGRLERGVRLPREGIHFFTWDPVRWQAPNRPARRHGTDRLVRTLLRVAKAHAAAYPNAPRMAVGDLSRPRGGPFDARFGALGEFGGPGTRGHVSHQNGLDADVYYPRRDGRERAPDRLSDIDLELAQDLVDRFVAAGAQFVFVGPRTGLTGPPGIVQPLERHDDHMHVRLPGAS